MATRRPFYTPVKRSHLIAPFGVGSMLMLRNGVSAVVCGLDEWESSWGRRSYVRNAYRVIDRALESALETELVTPPAVEDDPTGVYNGRSPYIPVARFPVFEYCVNPRCRLLYRRSPSDGTEGRCTACAGEPRSKRRRGWRTQQVPLVIVCEVGHLSSPPWIEWLTRHGRTPERSDVDDGGSRWQGTPRRGAAGDGGSPGGGGPSGSDARTCGHDRLTYTAQGDVRNPVVACADCGLRVAVFDMLAEEVELSCPGERPWFPNQPAVACDAPAVILERTATNAYYALVESAIDTYRGEDVRLVKLLERSDVIRGKPSVDELTDQEIALLIEHAQRVGLAADAERIRHAVEEVLRPLPGRTRSERRAYELERLLEDPPEVRRGVPPLVTERRPIECFRSPLFEGDALHRVFDDVVAVQRVAETRVLVGFSRVRPDGRPPGSGSRSQPLWAKARKPPWLPAHRVYGEGFLLVLNETRLSAWLAATGGEPRRMRCEVANDVAGGTVTPTSDQLRRALAHSLSHALLREAAVLCGYPLPSLRERIYVTPESTAVLLFTAAGDMHGTLGGLLELSKPGALEDLLDRAIRRIRWCAADPVCASVDTRFAQRSPGACHHCLLVPETTCELFNRWLDRSLLVNQPGCPAGWFDWDGSATEK